MPTYLVERYAPGSAGGSIVQFEPDRMDARGPVRHVMSTLIPGDEISFSLYEAPSEHALADALAADGLPYLRIVEAVVAGPYQRVPAGPGEGESR